MLTIGPLEPPDRPLAAARRLYDQVAENRGFILYSIPL
jgi:hypothetical protein